MARNDNSGKNYNKNNLNENGLTPKQQTFCDAYLKHKCAKQAAIDAGYSEKNSTQNAYGFMKIPVVKAYIASKDNALQDKVEWNREKHISELLFQYKEVRERHYKREALDFLKEIAVFLGINAPEKKEIELKSNELEIRIINPKKSID